MIKKDMFSSGLIVLLQMYFFDNADLYLIHGNKEHINHLKIFICLVSLATFVIR
jgi:hypothetical protein